MFKLTRRTLLAINSTSISSQTSFWCRRVVALGSLWTGEKYKEHWIYRRFSILKEFLKSLFWHLFFEGFRQEGTYSEHWPYICLQCFKKTLVVSASTFALCPTEKPRIKKRGWAFFSLSLFKKAQFAHLKKFFHIFFLNKG